MLKYLLTNKRTIAELQQNKYYNNLNKPYMSELNY